MAKGRKPAIANVARPEGFVDDVVRPIFGKVARSVAKTTMGSSSKRVRKVGISAIASSAESNLNRRASYEKQGAKLSNKAVRALRAEKYGKAEKLAGRAQVAANKSEAARQGGNVRKVAQQSRRDIRVSKGREVSRAARERVVAAKKRTGTPTSRKGIAKYR